MIKPYLILIMSLFKYNDLEDLVNNYSKYILG